MTVSNSVFSQKTQKKNIKRNFKKQELILKFAILFYFSLTFFFISLTNEQINKKVIEVTKLRKIYKSYESRRKLLGSYDMFLADDRITSLLPRLLGKKFFENKKFVFLLFFFFFFSYK